MCPVHPVLGFLSCRVTRVSVCMLCVCGCCCCLVVHCPLQLPDAHGPGDVWMTADSAGYVPVLHQRPAHQKRFQDGSSLTWARCVMPAVCKLLCGHSVCAPCSLCTLLCVRIAACMCALLLACAHCCLCMHVAARPLCAVPGMGTPTAKVGWRRAWPRRTTM